MLPPGWSSGCDLVHIPSTIAVVGTDTEVARLGGTGLWTDKNDKPLTLKWPSADRVSGLDRHAFGVQMSA